MRESEDEAQRKYEYVIFFFFWATYLGLSRGEFEECQMSYQQTLIGSIARVYRMSEKRKEARVKIKIEAHMSYV